MRGKAYDRIHYWLRRNYGRPKFCESTTCTKESVVFDWAKKTGLRHKKDRAHYLRLCHKCHVRYDWTDAKTRRLVNSGSRTPEARKKRSETLRGIKKPPQVGETARRVHSK